MPVWSNTGAATARIPGVRSASDPAQPRCLAVASSAASAVGSVTVRSVTASIPRARAACWRDHGSVHSMALPGAPWVRAIGTPMSV